MIAIAPDARFIPASNTKLYTTAAAFALLAVDAPDARGGAAVRIADANVILTGHGDARLSSATDCIADCLATLADAVAARTHRVRDVVGDDSAFPDERWGPGMSWNTIPTPSGTAVSALTLDDNEAVVTVAPGVRIGAPATVRGDGYLTIANRIVTTAGGVPVVEPARLPNTRGVRLDGTIALGAGPLRVRLGVDDPAERAAWRFAQLLRARGVTVRGAIRVRHRPLDAGDDPMRRGGAPVADLSEPPALARLVPGPLADDIRVTNKTSQNVHAELLLRRLGTLTGGGSIADGAARVRAMLLAAGVPRDGFDFADGSGMSSYNRVSPRATVALLRWAGIQPWGAAWRATFPVAGVDGTLARRFRGTALAGRLFAKTGSLNASNALAGTMIAASGRTLTFAFYANDVPEDVAATRLMDAALVAIAAAN